MANPNPSPETRFGPNNPGGRRPDTPEQKIMKKVIKELVKEYKEDLAQILPELKPVLIQKALGGDLASIKEIHDRVMGKPEQQTDITSKGEKIEIPIYGGLSGHNEHPQDIQPQEENKGS